MKISNLPKGGIYEVNFGYHSKMRGYTTLMSDIPKLYEIARMFGGKIKMPCALILFKNEGTM
jgi:hypothetical protein